MKIVFLLSVISLLSACGPGFESSVDDISESASTSGANNILVIKNISINQKMLKPKLEIKQLDYDYSL